MDIENEDYRDDSEISEMVEKIKLCATRNIISAIKKLEVELNERDSSYVEAMQNQISFEGEPK